MRPDSAAQDALHHDGLVPGAAGPAAHEQRQPVGYQAELGGAVVQLQQVAEDFLAVALLHLPQVGEHADGLGLDPAECVGGGGLCRGGAPLAAGEFADERVGGSADHGQLRQVEFGEHHVGGPALAQLGDRRGQRLLHEPLQLGRRPGQLVPGLPAFAVQGGHVLHALRRRRRRRCARAGAAAGRPAAARWPARRWRCVPSCNSLATAGSVTWTRCAASAACCASCALRSPAHGILRGGHATGPGGRAGG